MMFFTFINFFIGKKTIISIIKKIIKNSFVLSNLLIDGKAHYTYLMIKL